MSAGPGTGRPLLVAHRHGNLPDLTAAALARSVDLLEADVHLRRGVVEVRHADAWGPLHLDGWRITRRPLQPLTLGQLAADLGDSAELLVDLKRGGSGLTAAVAAAMRAAAPGRRYVVCGRQWELLAGFAAEPAARVALSAGTRREVAALPAAVARWRPWAVSVDARRLRRPGVVERLAALGVVVLAWTVNDAGRARDLLERGADGIVSDDLDVLDALGGGSAC